MSPPGCQKMSAKPCNRNAAESFPVLSLKSREQKPPNPLLIQDKNVLQPRLDPYATEDAAKSRTRGEPSDSPRHGASLKPSLSGAIRRPDIGTDAAGSLQALHTPIPCGVSKLKEVRR